MDPEESTLGGAFGITRPAGLSAASGRLNNLLGGLVWSSAVRMQREGKTLPEAFKQIACDLDVRGLIEFYAQFNGIRAEDAASLVDERILRTGKVSPAKVKAVYYEFANGIKEHEKSRKAR